MPIAFDFLRGYSASQYGYSMMHETQATHNSAATTADRQQTTYGTGNYDISINSTLLLLLTDNAHTDSKVCTLYYIVVVRKCIQKCSAGGRLTHILSKLARKQTQCISVSQTDFRDGHPDILMGIAWV